MFVAFVYKWCIRKQFLFFTFPNIGNTIFGASNLFLPVKPFFVTISTSFATMSNFWAVRDQDMWLVLALVFSIDNIEQYNQMKNPVVLAIPDRCKT